MKNIYNLLEFVLIPNQSKVEPVVFLLGWSDCDDKALCTYSRIYEDLGCITIRYTAPKEYESVKLKPLAKKLIDLIPEMSLEANPVFFHSFGNNGSKLYCHMKRSLEEEVSEVKVKVKGEIFDSGPGSDSGGWLGVGLITLLLFVINLVRQIIGLIVGLVNGQSLADAIDNFGEPNYYQLIKSTYVIKTKYL